MINTSFGSYFPAFNSNNTSWRTAGSFQGLPQPPSNSAAPTDLFIPSQDLNAQGPSGAQVLQQFGGDRLKAVKTALAASGGKAPENPEVPWYGKLLMPFVGGKTKTVSKNLGPDQTVTTKFKLKGFKLKDLRLTTRDKTTPGEEHIRHVDFGVNRPSNGKRGEIKNVGEILAKGQVKRMFDQEVTRPEPGQKGEIKNTYFDPKTGKPFLTTHEVSKSQGEDKFHTVRSLKGKQTFREIGVLGDEGKLSQRYVFDYGQKKYYHEDIDAQGQVTKTTNLPKHADFFKTVDLLSQQPPSSQAAPAPAPAAAERQAVMA